MEKLNLPQVDLKLKEEDGRIFIFDSFRKKYLRLTPEEWVRQNFMHFLVNYKLYPGGLLLIEKEIKYNQLKRRPDLVIYSREGEALMIVEFKAPKIKIDEEVFFQAAMYNKKLQVPYLILSNGMDHYCAQIDLTTGNLQYLKDIPNYNEL